MASWNVTLTYPVPVSETQLTAWEDLLGDDVTVAAIPAQGTTIAVWVDAPDPLEAAETVLGMVTPIVTSDPTAVDVVDEDTYLTEADAPTVPELVSSVEAGEILGVTRQRIGQLATDHPRFPTPLYELRTGPLWTRRAIEWFATNVDRPPGRRKQLANN
jgi:hypothetical protein